MQHKTEDTIKTPPVTKPVVLDSQRLFGSRRKIEIRHQDRVYQLSITRQNKLILTK